MPSKEVLASYYNGTTGFGALPLIYSAFVHRSLLDAARERLGRHFMTLAPDLEFLCRMFVHPDLDENSRFHIMRVMFGGQMDAHDFHRVGLSWPFLGGYLERAGFQSVRRVEAFGIFDDASSVKLFGNRISLNVEARKPA